MIILRLFVLIIFAFNATISHAEGPKWIGEKVSAGGGFSQFLNFQNRKSYGILRSTEQVRAGKTAWRFEVRSGDCFQRDCGILRERAELTARPFLKAVGQHWFAYSVYLSPEFVPQKDGHYTFGQIKMRDGISGFDPEMGQMSEPGLLYMDVEGSAFVLKVIKVTKSSKNINEREIVYPIASIDQMKGKWTDFMLHLDLDSNDKGLEVFVNGEKNAVYHAKLIPYPAKGIYFKFGIYRHFSMRQGKPATGTFPTDIVYFDEIRTGDSREKVDITIATQPVN